MDIHPTSIPSRPSAFAVVSADTRAPALPTQASLRAVSNTPARTGRVSVPPLLRLAADETGNDLVACLRRRCGEAGAPQLIGDGLTFIGTLTSQESAVYLRATTLALADDVTLAASLAEQRRQGTAPSPDAPASPLPPLLQEYRDAIDRLLRAVAANGAVMSGTYGFTTYMRHCLYRVDTAPSVHVAGTVLNDALHWQRGARQAIAGGDPLMWPLREEDPLGPTAYAFALNETTHDATAVLAELRAFHPWPTPGQSLATPGKVTR